MRHCHYRVIIPIVGRSKHSAVHIFPTHEISNNINLFHVSKQYPLRTELNYLDPMAISSENIKTLAEKAGGDLACVLKLVAYITDRAHNPWLRGVDRVLRCACPSGTGLIVDGFASQEL